MRARSDPSVQHTEKNRPLFVMFYILQKKENRIQESVHLTGKLFSFFLSRSHLNKIWNQSPLKMTWGFSVNCLVVYKNKQKQIKLEDTGGKGPLEMRRLLLPSRSSYNPFLPKRTNRRRYQNKVCINSHTHTHALHIIQISQKIRANNKISIHTHTHNPSKLYISKHLFLGAKGAFLQYRIHFFC